MALSHQDAPQAERYEMLAALALAATVYASPGTTYWSVSQETGVSVTAIEADNPWPADDIPVGAAIKVPGGGDSSSASTTSSDGSSSGASSPSGPGTGSQTGGAGTSSGGGFQIPGLPASLSNCIAWKESTDGQTSWNVFQITPGSGFTVTPGMSLAQQEQVAGQVVAADGAGAWTRFDGC